MTASDAVLDLEPSEDERLLREAARGALARVAPHRGLTAADGDGAAPVQAHWELARAMGWTGLLVPEASGGPGLGLREAAVIAEQLGHGLFCGPFAATAVLAPTLLAAGGGDAACRLLASIGAGEAAIALAAVRDDGAWLADAPDLPRPDRPRSGGDARAVSRVLVEYPATATHVLVLDAVRAAGGGHTLGVAWVAPGAGCRVAPCQPFDVTCPVARVEIAAPAIAAAPGFVLTLGPGGLDALLRPFHVAVAAELVGIAQAVLDRAVAHARERRQFGVPIGSFQSLKHRLADAFMLVENARLAVRDAALRADGRSGALIARTLAAEAALKAAGDCVQIQGGLGFSWENDAHLYLKRARRLAAALGSSQDFRAGIAADFIAAVAAAPEPAR